MSNKNTVVILQPNYIPWKGVFDLIEKSDTFIFLDDVDFTKRDWRTRNRIKTANGSAWLSVPVKKAPRGTKITDIEIITDDPWREKHRKAIQLSYSKAPFFEEYCWLLDEIYGNPTTSLSKFNIEVTKLLSRVIGVDAVFVNSSDLNASGAKDDRLIALCQKVNGSHYLSGPAAQDYISQEKFASRGIGLSYIEYLYPVYPQLFGEFDHYVSVLDVIFNCGPESKAFVVSD